MNLVSLKYFLTNTTQNMDLNPECFTFRVNWKNVFLLWLGTAYSIYIVNVPFFSMLIFLLLFIGFPSPLFLYLWHLYLSLFSSLREAETAKLLSNTFRMVHAMVGSLPLMIINLSTLYHTLLADGFEEYAMDLGITVCKIEFCRL